MYWDDDADNIPAAGRVTARVVSKLVHPTRVFSLSNGTTAERTLLYYHSGFGNLRVFASAAGSYTDVPLVTSPASGIHVFEVEYGEAAGARGRVNGGEWSAYAARVPSGLDRLVPLAQYDDTNVWQGRLYRLQIESL